MLHAVFMGFIIIECFY